MAGISHWNRLRKLVSSEVAVLGCRKSPTEEAMDVISAALSPIRLPNAPSRCDVLDCSACSASFALSLTRHYLASVVGVMNGSD